MKPKPRCRTKSSSASGKSTSKKHLTHRKGAYYYGYVDKLEYEFNKTGDIDFYSGELYLNAIGDVVSGCDWSYKSQKKYRFGNVMNKNWLENISNSELYIAS